VHSPSTEKREEVCFPLKISLNIFIVISSILAFIGLLVGFFGRKRFAESRLRTAESMSQKIIEEAEKKAEILRKEALLQAKDKLYQAKAEFEKETIERRQELQVEEKRLHQKEANLDKKVELIDFKEVEISRRGKDLSGKERLVAEQQKEYDELIEKQRIKLERIANISSEEAKRMLVESMESEAKHEAARRIKAIEEETRELSDKKAKEIISLAVQRYAGDYVADRTVSVVNLPNDEMKGRIIGREGRNIRALEAATGIDLIIDDTPEAVILSGFNPIRREIARIALERLISDGRIHPCLLYTSPSPRD